MIIKRIIMTMVMMAVLGFVVSQASAQEKSRPPDKDRMEQHLAMLKDRLKLTDDQESQIRAIFEESRKQAMAEKGNNSGNHDQALKARMDARKAADDKIMKVLKDDQKKEYSKIKEEEQKNMMGHHRHGDQKEQGNESGNTDNKQKSGGQTQSK